MPQKSEMQFLDRIENRQFLVLLGTVILLCYLPTLFNGYSVDDYIVLKADEAKLGFEGILPILKNYHHTIDGYSFGYRPIAKLTLAVEYELFGECVWISHLVNILLYSLLVFQIFYFFNLTFPKQREWIMLTILLFSLHPIHVEIVASIKNREELLAGVFSMAAIRLCYNYYRGHKTTYALIPAFFLMSIALFSKLFALFYILLFLTLLVTQQRFDWKRMIIAAIPLGLAMIFVRGVFTVFFNSSFSRLDLQPYAENHLNHIESASSWLATAFYCVYYNIRLLVFPHPLSFFYGYKVIPIADFSMIKVWVGIGIIVGSMTSILYFLRSGRKHLLFLAILFLLIIVMISNFLFSVPGAAADRFLLIPSLCFTGILAFLLLQITNPRIAAACLLIVSVLYSTKVIFRSQDWKSEISLAERDARMNPDAVIPNIFLAIKYIELAKEKPGDSLTEAYMENAVYYAEHAKQIFPEYYVPHYILYVVHREYYKDDIKAQQHLDSLYKASILDGKTIQQIIEDSYD